MKNTSEFTANISKEARNRVWWCLYTFEHMLGVMTGRATCILDGVCTSPLPLPFEGNQLQEPLAAKLLNDLDLREQYVGNMASSYIRQMSGNPSGGTDAKHTDIIRDVSWLQSLLPTNALCFLYYADLAVISQEIVNRVYSPTCAIIPWAHIENRIGVLRSRIDLWHANLHKAFDFTRKEDEEPSLLRGKLFLAFHYYSSRITLGRPCLCRRDAHLGSNGGEKPSFSHIMAVITLDSASQMLDLIPDRPDAIQLYELAPWWCVLHYLMQAVTVLLLELSFGNIHVPDREQDTLRAAKKGVHWLHCMSELSIASRRAWQICDLNLRKIAIGMNYDVSDLPTFIFGVDREQTMEDYNKYDNYNPNPNPNVAVPDGDVSFTNTGAELTVPQLPFTPLSTAPEAPGLPNVSDLVSPMDVSGPPGSGSAGSGSGSGGGGIGEGGSYFPYDPIHGEFIRSFFPAYREGGGQDHPYGPSE